MGLLGLGRLVWFGWGLERWGRCSGWMLVSGVGRWNDIDGLTQAGERLPCCAYRTDANSFQKQKKQDDYPQSALPSIHTNPRPVSIKKRKSSKAKRTPRCQIKVNESKRKLSTETARNDRHRSTHRGEQEKNPFEIMTRSINLSPSLLRH